MSSWQADPLEWGHGNTIFEIFLEPTCPFSVRAFNKLDNFLKLVGEDKLTIKIRLQSQPWHLFSGILTRCVLAASTLPEGKAAAKKVLQAIGEHREDYVLKHHAYGANLDVTPNQLIERLEKHSGVALKEAFVIPDLDKETRWHCKYARQNGIHVSPTVMVNGLVSNEFSSGDTVEQWAEKLAALI